MSHYSTKKSSFPHPVESVLSPRTQCQCSVENAHGKNLCVLYNLYSRAFKLRKNNAMSSKHVVSCLVWKLLDLCCHVCLLEEIYTVYVFFLEVGWKWTGHNWFICCVFNIVSYCPCFLCAFVCDCSITPVFQFNKLHKSTITRARLWQTEYYKNFFFNNTLLCRKLNYHVHYFSTQVTCIDLST